MESPAELSNNGLKNLLTTGGDAGGRRVSLRSLLGVCKWLGRTENAVVLRNAIIECEYLRTKKHTTKIVKLPGITFEGCNFVGKVIASDSSFKNGLVFRNCEFNDDVVWTRLTVNKKFAVEQCHFAQDVNCTRLTAPLDIHITRSRFLRACELHIEASVVPDLDNTTLTIKLNNARLLFQRCVFEDQVTVNVQSQIKEISLTECRLSNSATANLICGPSIRSISLPKTSIDGRLIIANDTYESTSAADIDPWSWTVRRQKSPDAQGVAVKLPSATLDGSLILRVSSLTFLNTLNASLADGSVHVPLSQVRLESETDHGVSQSPLSRDPTAERANLELYSQYDQLATAFARTSIGDRHEDVCRFRSRRYRRVSRITTHGTSWYNLARLILIAILAFLLLYSIGVEQYAPNLIAVISIALICTILVSIPFILPAYSTISPAAFRISLLAVEWLFLDLLLGYGVRLRNTIGAIFVLIVISACIYGIGSRHFPENGEVLDKFDQNFMSEESHKSKLPSGLKASGPPLHYVSRAIYFSFLRFTNINNDEYRPTGRLQTVATVESLIGFLITTLFVALLGRKYLRL